MAANDNRSSPSPTRDFDLQSLLHPAQAFSHPRDVVNDADLSLNEKRAILASWASDACAVESAPALRSLPSGPVVTFDDIIDALRSLDHAYERPMPKPESGFRRRLRAWRRGRLLNGDGGIGLH